MKSFHTLRTPFIMLVLLALLPACRTAQEPEADVVVTLNPEFTVDLYEQRGPVDGRATFGLWVESVKTFPCADYHITSANAVNNSDITVQVRDIMEPDTCLGAPAKAHSFLPVGDLLDGEYELSFLLGEAIENKGTLKVANGRYEWNLAQPAGIDLQNRVLQRIPDGLVWGFISTPQEQDMPRAQQCIAAIKALSQDAVLLPDFYGYFTVSGSGSVFFHKSFSPEGNAAFFVRRLDGDKGALRNLLDDYRSDLQLPLQITCWSTEGEL
ncbi:MAG: hypothetical protein IPL65_08660 [Lewinellaceae bacterium]|nr:hypothetical protein [Lewinellaceae bacterium]